MYKSIIREKSYKFAIRIVNLCNQISEFKNAINITNQLFRSGTSIGANAHEAENASSRKDFINKMTISLKEASESQFWINLLFDTGYISETVYESIYSDCHELIKMLVALVKNTKDGGE